MHISNNVVHSLFNEKSFSYLAYLRVLVSVKNYCSAKNWHRKLKKLKKWNVQVTWESDVAVQKLLLVASSSLPWQETEEPSPSLPPAVNRKRLKKDAGENGFVFQLYFMEWMVHFEKYAKFFLKHTILPLPFPLRAFKDLLPERTHATHPPTHIGPLTYCSWNVVYYYITNVTCPNFFSQRVQNKIQASIRRTIWFVFAFSLSSHM